MIMLNQPVPVTEQVSERLHQAWDGRAYRRVVAVQPGVISIRDAKGKWVEDRHCYTAIVTEAV